MDARQCHVSALPPEVLTEILALLPLPARCVLTRQQLANRLSFPARCATCALAPSAGAVALEAIRTLSKRRLAAADVATFTKACETRRVMTQTNVCRRRRHDTGECHDMSHAARLVECRAISAACPRLESVRPATSAACHKFHLISGRKSSVRLRVPETLELQRQHCQEPTGRLPLAAAAPGRPSNSLDSETVPDLEARTEVQRSQRQAPNVIPSPWHQQTARARQPLLFGSEARWRLMAEFLRCDASRRERNRQK